MANPYLNFRETIEQDLVEDLIDEAIDIHSEQFYYIPRKLVSVDDILGEDRLSEFKTAYPIDAYLESVPNLEGQGMVIQQFGTLIDYTANLIITIRKWKDLVGKFGQIILPNRPCEGDLLYYPLGGGLFEIKFVDTKNPYAQLGKFYVYRLTIESFQYNSEKIDTGIKEIDVFEKLRTFDELSTEDTLNGGIGKIEVISGGKGYTNPTITVNSEHGKGAKFKIHTSDGVITKIDVLSEGEGYIEGDEILVSGDCEEVAVLNCSDGFTINVDEAGLGNNREFKNVGNERLVGFDENNPFGEV